MTVVAEMSHALGAGTATTMIFFPITYYAMRKQFNLKPLSKLWRPFWVCVVSLTILRFFFAESGLNTSASLTMFYMLPVIISASILFWTKDRQSDSQLSNDFLNRKNNSTTTLVVEKELENSLSSNGQVAQKNNSRLCRLNLRLSHPFKRITFLIFTLSSLLLVVTVLFPMPLSIQRHESWVDAQAGDIVGRTIVRVPSNCANSQLGKTANFPLDYQIAIIAPFQKNPSSTNNYDPIIKEMILGDLGKFRSEPPLQIDTDAEEINKARLGLNLDAPICVYQYCTVSLTAPLLDKVMQQCAKNVAQKYEKTSEVVWHLEERFEKIASLIAACVLFLCLSVFYDRTGGRLIKLIGHIINWIRHG